MEMMVKFAWIRAEAGQTWNQSRRTVMLRSGCEIEAVCRRHSRLAAYLKVRADARIGSCVF